MTPKEIADYGGPYLDRKVVRDPSTQMGSTKGNRLLEDVAQLTRTGPRAYVSFQLATSGSAIAPSAVTHHNMWGSGSSEKPTVARTGAGQYTITWAATYDDGIQETENVVFTFPCGEPNVRGTTNGRARVVSIVSNVVTISVYNTSNVLSDLGGADTVVDVAVR